MITPIGGSARYVLGPRGTSERRAPAMAIEAKGTDQKIGLSATLGVTSSLKSSLTRSAIICRKPSYFPAYWGPTLSCILARSFLSQNIAKNVTKRAAKVKPGKVVQTKRLWKGS